MGPVILLGDEKSNFADAQFYRFASTKVAIITLFCTYWHAKTTEKGSFLVGGVHSRWGI
jgi:hypothetical protein